jgi:sodium-coupled neutral amino acid transporter 11
VKEKMTSRHEIITNRSFKSLKGFQQEGDAPLLGGSTQYVGENKPKGGTVSVLGASFLLWTDVAGVGALAAGYNMAIGGVYYAIAVTLIVAYVSEYTLKLVYFLYEKYQNEDYVDLMTFALGKYGRFFACLFMFIYNFGILCVNVMVIGSAVPALLEAAFGYQFAFRRELVLVYAFGIILPVCFLRDISSYTWTSAIYVICFITGVIVFIIMGIEFNVDHDFENFKNELTVINFPGFISATGSICFVFVCHDMSFSIAASMYQPTAKKWGIVCRACMVSNIFLTLSLGLFAFTVFKNETEAFIPDSYKGDDGGAYIIVARLAIVVMVFAGAPYACFLPRHALETMLFTFLEQERYSKFNQRMMKIGCTLISPVGAVAIAQATDDLGLVLSFLGGISASGLAFILPPLAFIKLEAGKWNERKKLPYSIIFGFGIFAVILLFVVTIRDIATPDALPSG